MKQNLQAITGLHLCFTMGGLGAMLLFALLALLPTQSLHAAPAAAIQLAPAAGITTTLTIHTEGSGNVTVAPAPPYNYGQVVTLSATPSGGTIFAGWTGDVGHPTNWVEGYKALHYRIGIDVRANGYARTDKVIEVALNFTTIFAGLGQGTATLAPASLRLVEIDANGQVMDVNIPWQLDQAANFDPTTNAVGTFVFLVKGNTAANGVRRYHLYFDVSGKSYTPPQFTDQVVRLPVASHFGQAAYEFQTPNGKYIYHRSGGGFASLIDRDRNDWISYSKQNGEAGDFRGIPNAIYPESSFHPGRTTSTTVSIASGPLKETIRTVTMDNKWEAIWEIFPTYARMTMLRNDHDYWFLYEGTPGGTLETAQDTWTRADGQSKTLANQWTQDLVGPEWIYFSDPDVEGSSTAARSLFLVQHQENSAIDTYYPSGGLMTVFGFGRNGTNRYLTTVPQQFTFGLMETTEFSAASTIINNAYRDLGISVLPAEVVTELGNPALTMQNPLTIRLTSNRTITANFE